MSSFSPGKFFRSLISAQRMLDITSTEAAEEVWEALDHAYTAAQQQPPRALDLTRDRYIIFSDIHRGTRDTADDFQGAEPAYNAAMAYYFERGYTLVVDGDVEELWKNAPGPVLRSYRHTLNLEVRFHREGRYLRLWGNHDHEWSNPQKVKKHLDPIYGDNPPLAVLESTLVQVRDQGQTLGTLFLVHGHQGTLESDRLAWLARPAVRYVWRPFQNLTGISLNSPAHDWSLAQGLDQWLYQWAARHEKMVLIAGHTHHPVFMSQVHIARLQEQITVQQARIAAEPDNTELKRELAEMVACLEWVRTRNRPGADDGTDDSRKPCYFNSGCCCFSDHDITGLELCDGQIRLIRWPDKSGEPQPYVLDHAPLREVFARC